MRRTRMDLATGRLHVRRSKGGETAVHPIGGKELRALRRLQSTRGTRWQALHIPVETFGDAGALPPASPGVSARSEDPARAAYPLN